MGDPKGQRVWTPAPRPEDVTLSLPREPTPSILHGLVPDEVWARTHDKLKAHYADAFRIQNEETRHYLRTRATPLKLWCWCCCGSAGGPERGIIKLRTQRGRENVAKWTAMLDEEYAIYQEYAILVDFATSQGTKLGLKFEPIAGSAAVPVVVASAIPEPQTIDRGTK